MKDAIKAVKDETETRLNELDSHILETEALLSRMKSARQDLTARKLKLDEAYSVL